MSIAFATAFNTHVAGIMQHMKSGGRPLWRRACSLPPYSMSDAAVRNPQPDRKLALALRGRPDERSVRGQEDEEVYLIGVNLFPHRAAQ
jgi:hypothetical protein